MEMTWDIQRRISAINEALARIPHDQTALGLGFKLRHSPEYCTRCRANIALLELGAIIDTLDIKDQLVETGETVDV